MNTSTMPATVAAEISGFGSFFGSCQIAANNFGDMDFETMLQNAQLNFPQIIAPNTNNIPNIQNSEESEVIQQLLIVLEDIDAELFKRVVNLLEKGSLSVQKDMDNLDLEDFLDLGESLLERIDLVIKQILAISNEIEESADENFSGEVFLNFLKDLLKTNLITPQEFETTLKNPEESTILPLLENLKEETSKFISALLGEKPDTKIVKTEKVAQTKQTDNVFNFQLRKDKIEADLGSDIPLEEAVYIYDLINEMGIKPENRAEFSNFVQDLLKNGTVTVQDLKEALKNPSVIEPKIESKIESRIEPRIESKIESKVEPQAEPTPTPIRNVLEKLWSSVENNKAEPQVKTELQAKVEPEVKAVWEGGDLKIEIVNPKTGEKLQSVPANGNMMSKMQERINEYEVIRQVVAQAKFITTPTGEQKMTMQLRPEHLGQLELRITLNHGEMQINARVESATAQQALESQIGMLREGLEKQGIVLERLEVSVEQRENRDSYALMQEQENQKHNREGKRKRRNSVHLAVSVAKNENADTGRRLGYNTMEYLA